MSSQTDQKSPDFDQGDEQTQAEELAEAMLHPSFQAVQTMVRYGKSLEYQSITGLMRALHLECPH